jgi:hypothetical protein
MAQVSRPAGAWSRPEPLPLGLSVFIFWRMHVPHLPWHIQAVHGLTIDDAAIWVNGFVND